jgi:CRISPR-associated protein Cmr3
MNIFIEPSDVWLFRDGRPFAPGERGRAASFFPPTPQTMQGVIRSLRIAQSGEPFDYRQWSEILKAEIGQPDNYGAVHLRGPLVAKRSGNTVQRFFPLPEDMTRFQSGWHILSPSDDRFDTNWQPPTLQALLPPRESEPTKFQKGWICEDGLLSYLKGNICGVHVHENSMLFLTEPRFGVQIDSGPKRPMEEMLYQIEFVRPQTDVGLLLEVSGVSLNSSGLLQLGGEARAGRYEKIEKGLDLPCDGRAPQIVGDKLRFKLYLATPGIFEQGWLPGWVDPQSLEGEQNGIKVKLIAAAVGKPQHIGGRDISKRDCQRAIRRAVPAGSVYFFETVANADAVMETFDGKCVSDEDADRQIGFGLCYLSASVH